MSRLLAGPALGLLVACAARAEAPPVVGPALPPDCPRGAPDPGARLAEGEALIAASMVGEHPVGWDYLWGLQAVREAADAGHAPALYLWGRERFSNLYLDAGPDPENTAERQVYLVAIASIATAARLGHPEARTFFPEEITAGLLSAEGPFADRVFGEDTPLPDLPTEWLESARQIVDHHRRCWPS